MPNTCYSKPASKNIILLAFLVFITCFFNGCASTTGSHDLLSDPIDKGQLTKFSDLLVIVESTPDIPMSFLDKIRIEALIINNIKKNAPSRFRSINLKDPLPETLVATIAVTQYEKGSAFARSMLAGLGQMHIDADVTLSDWALKAKLAKYKVSKTFAWGGIYGGSTEIRDIEGAFAQAVVNTILDND